jgi:hypothetical protein
MTKECKKARNTVLIPLIILLGLVLLLSSCANNYYLCDAYASIEQINCENCDEID